MAEIPYHLRSTSVKTQKLFKDGYHSNLDIVPGDIASIYISNHNLKSCLAESFPVVHNPQPWMLNSLYLDIQELNQKSFRNIYFAMPPTISSLFIPGSAVFSRLVSALEATSPFSLLHVLNIFSCWHSLSL